MALERKPDCRLGKFGDTKHYYKAKTVIYFLFVFCWHHLLAPTSRLSDDRLLGVKQTTSETLLPT